ncbi:MAG: hypothetical protein ACW98F_04360 [Candidatus Hodarchaeales archaeon]
MQEKACIECKRLFSTSKMIGGTKTNAYGDKVTHGYFCKTCFRKRIQGKSKILLAGSIGAGIISLFFFGLTGYMYFFVKSLMKDAFITTVETFNLLGFLFLAFAAVMYYLRYKELTKMRNQIRKLPS